MERRDSSIGTMVSMTHRGDVESLLAAEFDVFLNFRGPDTRDTFADYLYHSMDVAGIRVFRDDEEIRKGEVIGGKLERAIVSSSICIPIFSRDYASSAWCLRELTIMVDCKTMILPVFFDVSPDDVKLKTELYHDALQKHEEKFGGDVVRRWKEALGKVAQIKGWDLTKRGYHGELIRLIVEEVLNKLNTRDKNLPDHLVGIQDCVTEVMRLLDKDSLDVRYLVIHGMGGIGKTTLAKVIFNQIYRQFEGCSFLSDVREASKGSKIVQLQKQLLSDILGSKLVEISDSDVGINQIKRRFRHKKILMVLDDLDEWDHLSKLAEKQDWFGKGSRIIITTRDTNFLPIEEEHQENGVEMQFKEFNIYQMKELSHCHALQLFSRHAFGMDSPPHDYYNLSRDIIRKAGGLPLALKVIGSSLCRKMKPFWKTMLKKLDSIPNEDVLQKLKFSFEMLEDAQKDIFLDIACYFIDEEKIYPHYMWKALGIFPKIEILVLSRKALIKVDSEDRLSMHDLLKDLGREIVRQENKVLEKRSRIWSPENALFVLQHRKGTENITALKLSGLQKEHDFTNEELSSLPNLRLLELEGGNLVGDFKNLLSSLKWLSWRRCPSDLQAVNLCLLNLVVLKLSDSDIPENWNGWEPCLANCDLKVIHLKSCHLTIAPDFSTCLNLRILVFAAHRPESPQINGSVGKLERLKRLEITAGGVQPSKLSKGSRFEMCALPSAICCLKNISSLKLEGQCIQELHPSIGEMASLTCLSLRDCYRLRKIPDSIGKLGSLLELNLFNTRIRELPNSIADLKRLVKMNLGYTWLKELPESIGELESLLDLDLQRTEITALPASIGYLKRLQRLFMRESKIRELPNSLEDLKMLKELDLGSTQIRKLPNSIGGLESLLLLNLRNTKITEVPTSIGHLKRLKDLSMDEHRIRELPKAIGMLENPGSLLCDSCRNTDMTWPPQLLALSISCDDLQSLPSLPSGLLYLSLIGVKSPKKQPLLSKSRHLTELRLLECGSREIEFDQQLENLCGVDFRGCESLVRLSNLSKLGKLISLDIDSCSWLIEIRDLGEIESLEELKLRRCSSLERLPNLSKLHKLHRLSVEKCESLQDLPDLPNSLEELLIWKLSSVQTLPQLSKLQKLESLCISHSESLQGLPDLPNSLEELLIRKLSSVQTLPQLSKLQKLESLCLWHCESLQGLPDLPNSLKRLAIMKLSSIQTLPQLSKLQKLESLNIGDCESLKELPDLPNICNLDIHAHPTLGVSSACSKFCRWCAESHPLLSFRSCDKKR